MNLNTSMFWSFQKKFSFAYFNSIWFQWHQYLSIISPFLQTLKPKQSSALSNFRIWAGYHDAVANGDFHNLCGYKSPRFGVLTFANNILLHVLMCCTIHVWIKHRVNICQQYFAPCLAVLYHPCMHKTFVIEASLKLLAMKLSCATAVTKLTRTCPKPSQWMKSLAISLHEFLVIPSAISTHSNFLSMNEAIVDCQDCWTVTVTTTLDAVFFLKVKWTSQSLALIELNTVKGIISGLANLSVLLKSEGSKTRDKGTFLTNGKIRRRTEDPTQKLVKKFSYQRIH